MNELRVLPIALEPESFSVIGREGNDRVRKLWSSVKAREQSGGLLVRIYNESKLTMSNIQVSQDFMLGNQSQATNYISRYQSLLPGQSAVSEFNTYDSWHNGGSIEFDRCQLGGASYEFEA